MEDVATIILAFIGFACLIWAANWVVSLIYRVASLAAQVESVQNLRRSDQQIYAGELDRVTIMLEAVGQQVATMLNNMNRVLLIAQHAMNWNRDIIKWWREHNEKLIAAGLVFPAAPETMDTPFDWEGVMDKPMLDKIIAESATIFGEIDRLKKDRFTNAPRFDPDKLDYDKSMFPTSAD